jgi:hypothetical protein
MHTGEVGPGAGDKFRNFEELVNINPIKHEIREPPLKEFFQTPMTLFY